MKHKKVGQLRSSEIITTYGPGAIFNGKEGISVMIMGLDSWSEAFDDESDLSKFKVIHNKFLEDVCKKDHFRMPSNDGGFGGGIPCTVFPTWGYCEFGACKKMSKVEGKPDVEKGFYVCKYCRKKYGYKNKILPARLILLCDYGHVQDFPWEEWAHSKTKYQEAGFCDTPIVKLIFGSGGTTLSNYRVECTTCGKKRSMFGATEPLLGTLPKKNGESFELKCTGNSPWLGKKVLCPPKNSKSRDKKSMKGNHVRASNMYFPMIVSALQIPRFYNSIQKIIDDEKRIIEFLIGKGTSFEDIASEEFFSKLKVEHSKIVDELKYRFIDTVNDEDDIKNEEYDDLFRNDDIDYKKNNDISITDVSVHSELKPYISKIKRVDRLTMIKTLRYFTRGEAPDPYDYESIINKHTSCKISKSTKIDWLPCVETRGEGIFFTLNEDKIKEWEKHAKIRCQKIIDNYAEFNSKRGWSGNVSPKYILLHTLAHALIRELAYNSGYGESSISERIYSTEKTNAILLYTSSNSSEGSLGGLVRNSAPDEFLMTVKGAISKSRLCSRDPLCMESNIDEGPIHTRLNGSACYACSLLPETSCENFNRLLDRFILCDNKLGFFSDLE
ncbi:MAG: DUF1998 domain-containing protein [Thaumarchaeota archaeon]|nr:DUF1998 domain-containing protein [Nitrososphaerota archaeon]